jgi:hypothetical protein
MLAALEAEAEIVANLRHGGVRACRRLSSRSPRPASRRRPYSCTARGASSGGNRTMRADGATTVLRTCGPEERRTIFTLGLSDDDLAPRSGGARQLRHVRRSASTLLGRVFRRAELRPGTLAFAPLLESPFAYRAR